MGGGVFPGIRIANSHPSRTASKNLLIILTGTNTSLILPAPPVVRCDDDGCWATLRPPPVEQPDWRLLWQRGQLVGLRRRRLYRPHTPQMHPQKSVFLCYLSPPSFRLHVPLSFHISTLLNLLSQVVCHQDEAAALPNFGKRGWNWVFLTNFNAHSPN